LVQSNKKAEPALENVIGSSAVLEVVGETNLFKNPWLSVRC